MHTVNNRTQLICCVYFLYKAGELIVTQPSLGHATSVTIYPLGTHVVRTSATEHSHEIMMVLMGSYSLWGQQSSF